MCQERIYIKAINRKKIVFLFSIRFPSVLENDIYIN